MASKERLEYLDRLNRELARELIRYDMLCTRLRVSINSQKNTLSLINSLQQKIGVAGNDEDFYRSVADLISRHLQMITTYIGLPDRDIPGRLNLLGTNEYLDEKYLPDLFTPFILKRSDKKRAMQKDLRERFKLDSLIYFPVLFNNEIKIAILTGRANVDYTMTHELNEEDLRALEAVGILISSFLSKAEMIKLAETDRIKTEFVSNLSHEFRTPLTLVLGLLDEMKQSLLPIMDDREKESFQVVYRNAARIKELISQLIDISQLETNTERLLVEKGDLAAWLNNLATTYVTLARKKGIKFQYTISGSSRMFWYDPDKLEKIISNLLSNAIKYSGREGTVELFLFLEEEEGLPVGRFVIRDNGPGIPEHEQENIFKRFYRISGKEGSQQEGTGVGLYIVKELSELHRGKISVESSPGRGSSFTLIIPLSEEAYSKAEPEEAPDVGFHIKVRKNEKNSKADLRGRQNILVVEDNSDLNQFITANLEKHFSVKGAMNGNEGLELARKEIPDLVISDIMMPVMDGVEMTRKMKKDAITSHIPILLLTARADRQSKIEGLDCGADDYITKPFDMEELLLKVRNHIATSEQIRLRFRRIFLESPDEFSGKNIDDLFIKNLSKLLKQNLENPGFQVEDLCRELGISRSQLYRKLYQLTGLRPAEILRNLRIGTAAAMFRKGHNNVTQVMYAVGFNNPSHFAMNFKKFIGSKPSAYIKDFSL